MESIDSSTLFIAVDPNTRMNCFDDDDARVHQDADREDEREERDDVECIS